MGVTFVYPQSLFFNISPNKPSPYIAEVSYRLRACKGMECCGNLIVSTPYYIIHAVDYSLPPAEKRTDDINPSKNYHCGPSNHSPNFTIRLVQSVTPKLTIQKVNHYYYILSAKIKNLNHNLEILVGEY